MKVFTTENIRNISLLGHRGSGKTTLVESILYVKGYIKRKGDVENGTTVSDFDKEEIRRIFSINTSLISVEQNDVKLNFLDTPGYFGGTVDLLDWIISIGGSGGDTLKISNNKDAYIKLFRGKITNSNSIIDFLETSVNKLAPGTIMDGWFKNASKAFIVETPSKENPNATTTLYSKLKSGIKSKAP